MMMRLKKRKSHTDQVYFEGVNTYLKRAQGFHSSPTERKDSAQKIRCLGEPIGFIFFLEKLTGSDLRADDSVDLLDTFINSNIGREELI